MDYPRAFNQKSIYKEFHELMQVWGCANNVKSVKFGNAIKPPSNLLVLNPRYLSTPLSYLKSGLGSIYSKLIHLCSETHPLRTADNLSSLTDHPTIFVNLEKQYKRKCLEKLFAEKRWNIAAPGRQALLDLAVIFAGGYVTSRLVDADSYGGSFSKYAVAMHSSYILKDIFETMTKLIWPPTGELDIIEIQYAINKCFIPSPLWPEIEEMFLLARSNSFEERNCINFIQFALGLTVYKPKTPFQNALNSDKINEELDKRIDNFFSEYNTSLMSLELFKLKSGIHDFVRKLIDNSDNIPKYIHLHGRGGIGKTYFVRELCKWINELLPNGVNFEDATIDDPQDLEGSRQKPGILLKVLRNQLQSEKQGSVVFMDEASWLNNPQAISAAKRVFNGDLTRISTHYFGSGIGGSAINLEMPPTLIFVASNEAIQDENLASRFINIEFPMPAQKTLLNYAYKIFETSNLYEKALLKGKVQEIKQKITDAVKQNEKDVDTFRVIEQFTKPFVLKELSN